MKKNFVAASILCLSMVTVLAKEFWEKPFTEWKKGEISKLLNKSPWADEVVFTRQIAGQGTGIAGEKELYDIYTVRFFSALPIRQAYVRMLQLMNRYDERTAEQKQEMDARFSRPLKLDTSEIIIVALEFSSNDRQLVMNVQRTLQQNTAELLKQNVYLISARLGRVQLKEYHPPLPDGTGAKFVFPRHVDGKPVVSPEDKEVKFEFYVPEAGHKIFTSWKVKKMIYNGELAI